MTSGGAGTSNEPRPPTEQGFVRSPALVKPHLAGRRTHPHLDMRSAGRTVTATEGEPTVITGGESRCDGGAALADPRLLVRPYVAALTMGCNGCTRRSLGVCCRSLARPEGRRKRVVWSERARTGANVRPPLPCRRSRVRVPSSASSSSRSGPVTPETVPQSCPKQTAPGPALVEMELDEGSFLNEVFDRGSRAVRRSPHPEGSGPLEANPSPSSSRCLHGKRCRFLGSCERRYAKSSDDERGSGLRTAVSAATPVRPWELADEQVQDGVLLRRANDPVVRQGLGVGGGQHRRVQRLGERNPDSRVGFWEDAYATKPGSLQRVGSARRTAASLLAWLRSNPNLTVSKPTTGKTARSVRASWTSVLRTVPSTTTRPAQRRRARTSWGTRSGESRTGSPGNRSAASTLPTSATAVSGTCSWP